MERMGRKMEELSSKTEALEKLYGAQLLWKIDNYTQKFNEAKAGAKTTVFSPPFLTGRHGYKMAMSACLYGDGKGSAHLPLVSSPLLSVSWVQCEGST